MKFLAALCLYVVFSMLASLPAAAEQQGMSIDSFRIVNAGPQFVDIEFTGSNDGSQGDVWLGVLSRSKDGSVRSDSFRPAFFAAGQQAHIAAQVSRPVGAKKQQTDFLVVMVYKGSGDVLFRRKFEWPHVWPEVSAQIDDRQEASIENPGLVLFDNLEEGAFAEADALLEKWNDPRERDKNGEWKMGGFRTALDYALQARNWKANLQSIQEWKRLNPNSPGAAIAEAYYWMAGAWSIRGNDDSVTPDPVAMKIFRERMGRAENILVKSKEYASSLPLWYDLYLDIAAAARRNGSFVANLFKEAVRKHPGYPSLYVDMASYLAPREKGRADWAAVDKVVNGAVSLTSDTDGASSYARIYSAVSSRQKFEFDLFRDSFAAWSRMRPSFEDMVAHYPSKENLNRFAVFACRAGDKKAFLKMKALIGDRIIPQIWPGNYSLDLCSHRFLQYD